MISIAYNELDYLHDLDNHVENSERTKVIISKIKEIREKKEIKADFFVANELRYSDEIISWVKLVHKHDYIDLLIQKVKKIKKIDFLDPDTYITPHTLDVVFTNLELLFGLCDRIIRSNGMGFAYIRPPGHHAESNRAMGFCIINNVAVLARFIQKQYNMKKIMIVDFDAHHGNGTQEIFYEDSSVLYFSTHAYPFYPFTGSLSEKGRSEGYGYTYNFPLSIYAGDKELINIYENEFISVFDSFQPDFLIVSSGYDIHSHDPITYMTCSSNGIKKIKDIIISKAGGKNLIFVLEGGYNLNVLKEVVEDDINRIK